MDTEATIRAADDAMLEDDLQEAESLYTKALALEPYNINLLTKRALCYQKLKRYADALKDATEASRHISPTTPPDVAAKVYLRQGIAQYHLEQYKEAHQAFLQAESSSPSERTVATWIAKCKERLPPETNVVDASSGKTTPAAVKARHEWYQNDAKVVVEIFIKNLKKDAVDIQFTSRTLSVSVAMPTAGSTYSLEVDPLAHEIDPNASAFEVLSTKIEISMAKARRGVKWGMLEGEDQAVPYSGNSMSTITPAIASQVTHKNKNWDKILSEVDEPEEQATGDKALNDLFAKIYADADDDTKKAMLKSFTESGGTTLSTNWSEVSKGQVKVKPPEGMVEKKYDA